MTSGGQHVYCKQTCLDEIQYRKLLDLVLLVARFSVKFTYILLILVAMAITLRNFKDIQEGSSKDSLRGILMTRVI